MTLSIIPNSEHLPCKDEDCPGGDFWLKPDGRIVCADDECHALYGHAPTISRAGVLHIFRDGSWAATETTKEEG